VRLGVPGVIKVVPVIIRFPIVVTVERRIPLDIAAVARVAAEPWAVAGLGHRAQPVADPFAGPSKIPLLDRGTWARRASRAVLGHRGSNSDGRLHGPRGRLSGTSDNQNRQKGDLHRSDPPDSWLECIVKDCAVRPPFKWTTIRTPCGLVHEKGIGSKHPANQLPSLRPLHFPSIARLLLLAAAQPASILPTAQRLTVRFDQQRGLLNAIGPRDSRMICLLRNAQRTFDRMCGRIILAAKPV
jgi:hypothetical protein